MQCTHSKSLPSSRPLPHDNSGDCRHQHRDHKQQAHHRCGAGTVAASQPTLALGARALLAEPVSHRQLVAVAIHLAEVATRARVAVQEPTHTHTHITRVRPTPHRQPPLTMPKHRAPTWLGLSNRRRSTRQGPSRWSVEAQQPPHAARQQEGTWGLTEGCPRTRRCSRCSLAARYQGTGKSPLGRCTCRQQARQRGSEAVRLMGRGGHSGGAHRPYVAWLQVQLLLVNTHDASATATR